MAEAVDLFQGTHQSRLDALLRCHVSCSPEHMFTLYVFVSELPPPNWTKLLHVTLISDDGSHQYAASLEWHKADGTILAATLGFCDHALRRRLSTFEHRHLGHLTPFSAVEFIAGGLKRTLPNTTSLAAFQRR